MKYDLSDAAKNALVRAADLDDKDQPITVSKLGVARATVSKLVDGKFLKRLTRPVRTGTVGRPAHRLSITAKGRRAAAA